MEEAAELREALNRAHTLFEDLTVRGLRSAGAKELARLSALRDEFRAAGAEHLASELTLVETAVRQDDRHAPVALLKALTSLRLFDRVFTLHTATASLEAATIPEE